VLPHRIAGAQGEVAGAVEGPGTAEFRGNGSKLTEVAVAARLADSCRVRIRIAVAKSCAGFENAIVFVSGLEIKVFRINRSIVGRGRLVRAFQTVLLTIC
jgi:hypothetical protein